MVYENVLYFSGFGKDPATSKFELYAQIARISLVGHYKARGNILLLPIFGQGPANLTLGKALDIRAIKHFSEKPFDYVIIL